MDNLENRGQGLNENRPTALTYSKRKKGTLAARSWDRFVKPPPYKKKQKRKKKEKNQRKKRKSRRLPQIKKAFLASAMRERKEEENSFGREKRAGNLSSKTQVLLRESSSHRSSENPKYSFSVVGGGCWRNETLPRTL